MDDVLKEALAVDDPEKLFSKLIEEAEEVLVPADASEPPDEITAHWSVSSSAREETSNRDAVGRFYLKR